MQCLFLYLPHFLTILFVKLSAQLLHPCTFCVLKIMLRQIQLDTLIWFSKFYFYTRSKYGLPNVLLKNPLKSLKATANKNKNNNF